MQIKTPKDTISHLLGWFLPKKKKKQEITNVENVKKRETLCTVSAIVNQYSHYEKQFDSTSKN